MNLPKLLTVLFSSATVMLAATANSPLPTGTPEEQHMSAARLKIAHESLDREVTTARYSGYVMIVARNGKVVDWHASGYRDLATKAPMERDTIFRIYSMSKLVTTVAALTLIEDGKLQLNDPVEKYLPALKDRMVYTGGPADAPVLVPAAHKITIKQLMNHTAGYYYDASWSADPIPSELMSREKIWEAANLDEFVQRVAKLPLNDQPGTRFRYGINVDLLGAVVEKVSGQRLSAYLEQRIFQPLGMVDTAFWVPEAKRSRLAVLYEMNDGTLRPAKNLVDMPTADRGVESGGGGLFSTAADYLRFAQMLLNGGELDGKRILGRKTIELMTSNTIDLLADPHPFNQKEVGFGLGVRVVNDLGQARYLGSPGMFGWDGAATTLYWIDPKEQMVSILMTQHLPYNEDDIFAFFMDGVYSAVER